MFRERLYLPSTNPSSDHIWTMEISYMILRCHFYSSQRLELFDNLNKINSSFFKLSAKDQVSNLLYGYSSNNPISLSEDIIKLVINFLIKSGRFDRPLIRLNQLMCFFIFLFYQIVLIVIYVIFWYL